MKIAIDAMGGDYAPAVVVEGAVQAATQLGIPAILVGQEAAVRRELARFPAAADSLEVVPAQEVVEMQESPGHALKSKRNSSIRVCFDLVREGRAGAVVTAGNSGAAMAFGIAYLKTLPGVERPAICQIVPTPRGQSIILDIGANVDCKAYHLVQFAIMGGVYAQFLLRKESPTIGVLSNGEEESKGNELTREAHQLLKNTSLNYRGYVEGRDIFLGTVDVIVCDGFVGNVALKLSEGLIESFQTMMYQELEKSLLGRIGSVVINRRLVDFKRRLDYCEYGGAPLLGLNGLAVICHGGSSAYAIRNAIRMGHTLAQHQVNAALTEGLTQYVELHRVAAKATTGGVRSSG